MTAPIYLVAAPASRVQPSGTIDARAGHPAYPEDEDDAQARLAEHVALSDEPLMVYRCRREGSWWVVMP